VSASPKPSRRGPKPRKPIRRTSRPRKQRASSIGAMKRKLWALFSAYVKARDGNRCFTCPATGLEGGNWHAGHFIRKDGHAAVEYDPKNVHSQCGACNLWRRGNVHVYALRIIDTYGSDEFRRLIARSHLIHTWHAPQLRELIEAIQHSPEAYECLYYERYL
jgi:hypothetical protein